MIANTIPGKIKPHIAKLDQIAGSELEGIISSGNDSLDKIKEIIENVPYRELKPQTVDDQRKAISAQTNLSAGPQSQISESMSVEDLLRKDVDDSYSDSAFSFRKMTESEVFGFQLDPDSMSKIQA